MSGDIGEPEVHDPEYSDIVVVMQTYERMRVIQDKQANVANQMKSLADQQQKLYSENDSLATEYRTLRGVLDEMRVKYGDVVPPAR